MNGEKWYLINFGHVILPLLFRDPVGPMFVHIKIDWT